MTDQPATSWAQDLDAHQRKLAAPHGSEVDHRLVPNTELPLGETAVYETLTLTSLPQSTDRAVELAAPIDLRRAQRYAQAPAEGVLLTHEQAWRLKGVTLGRLLHSMPLAPGEVTQIATSGWTRRSRGQSEQDVAEREAATRDAGRDRDIHDVVDAVASQSGFGMSSASSSSSQGGGGLALPGLSAGGSANTASASTFGFSVGSRSAKAEARQHVRESTHQHASNVRGKRAAIVQEVSESETEQFQTRVVANYNHQHSLNMLYFEVLQVFELSTHVTDARRCLFLPMQVRTFDAAMARDFSRPLALAARSIGAMALSKRLHRLDEDIQIRAAHIDELQAEFGQHSSDIGELQSRIEIDEIVARGSNDENAVDLAELERIRRTKQTIQRDLQRLHRQQSTLDAISDWFIEAGESIADFFDPNGNHDPTTEHGQLLARLKHANERETELNAEIGRRSRAALVAADALSDLRRRLTKATGDLDRVRAELRTLREADVHVESDILHQLNERKLGFNQALWMLMNPAQVAAAVADKEHHGEVLASTIDPTPIGVSGNYVAFRWPFPAGKRDAAEAFLRRHTDDDASSVDERDTIVLPTGATFAEAVPGRANSAEKLDLTRFWRWDHDTIPILPAAIDQLRQQHRARAAEAKPGSLGDPAIRIQAMPDGPERPAHQMAAALGASMFRDMSGADVIGPLVEAAQNASGTTAGAMQQQAHENISAYLDHLEEVAPKVLNLLSQQQANGKSGGPGPSGASEAEGGAAEGLDASEIGGLQNAIGEEGAGLDIGALAGEAAEMGLFLL